MQSKPLEVKAHGFYYSVVAIDLHDPMDRIAPWKPEAVTAHILVNRNNVALCGMRGECSGTHAGYAWHYLDSDDPRPVCKKCIAELKKVGKFAEELEKHNEEMGK